MKNLKGLDRPWFIANFSNGPKQAYFSIYGVEAWLNTIPWRESPGSGKPPTGRTSKPLLPENLPDPTRRIGEKNRTKRHILVDESGVPLSLVVSGANRHDSVPLGPLLKARVVKPDDDNIEQNLCLDAAYVGKEETAKDNGFIPHIRPRGEEKRLLEKDSTFKARRWVVELSHSWFNRFRKLLPRYEKTDLSYMALS